MEVENAQADSHNKNVGLFLPLIKVDPDERLVWGYASTPTKDLQNERVSIDAIKGALPDYMEWANLREMHQLSAVGTTKSATLDDKGLYICGHISDDQAWQKVKDGVYKGFSIGGDIVSKTGDEITQMRLTEISLVDRPANPEARIDAIKAAQPIAKSLMTIKEIGPAIDGVEKKTNKTQEVAIVDMPVFNAQEVGFMGRIIAKLTGLGSINKAGDGFSAPAPMPHATPRVGSAVNELAAKDANAEMTAKPGDTNGRSADHEDMGDDNVDPFKSNMTTGADDDGEPEVIDPTIWPWAQDFDTLQDWIGSADEKSLKAAFKYLTQKDAHIDGRNEDELEKAKSKIKEECFKRFFSKREFSDKEREHLADTGAAESDGSYPIKNEQDLKNAIRAYGRSKNKAKTKAHIKSRAAALGLSHLIPDSWSGESDNGEASDKADAIESLAKMFIETCGNYGASNLHAMAAIYDNIKSLIQSMRFEGALEHGDPRDIEMSAKIETLLDGLGALIAEKATHEVSEEEDKTEKVIDALKSHGITEESVKMAETIFNRMQKGRHHAATMGKAAHHMGKCRKCIDKAMGHIHKCHEMHKSHMLLALAAKNNGVRKAEFDHAAAMSHLSAAHEALSDAHDQAALAHASLGGGSNSDVSDAASGWEGESGESPTEGEAGVYDPTPGGSHKDVPQHEMTEGDVEDYGDGSMPYNPNRSHNNPGHATETGIKAQRITLTKAELDERIAAATEAATLKAQVANLTKMLERIPNGPPRAKMFGVDKANLITGNGEESNPVVKMFEGVDVGNIHDQDDASRAASKVIQNIVTKGFGKPVIDRYGNPDPNFRGNGGVHRN